MSLNDAQLGAQLATLVADFHDSTDANARAALVTAVSNLFAQAGLVLPTVLAQHLQDHVNVTEQWIVQFRAWAVGTADGGPNRNGEYPLVDRNGSTVMLASPAKIRSELFGLTPRGMVDTYEDLDTLTGVEVGDIYTDREEGHAWVWSLDGEWMDLGLFRGPSVFQVWVALPENAGKTEQDYFRWLADAQKVEVQPLLDAALAAQQAAEDAQAGAVAARQGAEAAKLAAEAALAAANARAEDAASSAETSGQKAADAEATRLATVAIKEQATAATQAIADQAVADTQAIKDGADQALAAAIIAQEGSELAETGAVNAKAAAEAALAAAVTKAGEAGDFARVATDKSVEAGSSASRADERAADAETALAGALVAQGASEAALADTVAARDIALGAKADTLEAREQTFTARDEADAARIAAEAARDQANEIAGGNFQVSDPTLTEVAKWSWTSGKVVFALAGNDTFTPLRVGAANATDLLDRASADGRYRLQSTVITVGDVQGLQAALNSKATPADIQTAIDGLKAGAPAIYDTLAEIAQKFEDDDDVTASILSEISTKAAQADLQAVEQELADLQERPAADAERAIFGMLGMSSTYDLMTL